MGTSNSLDVYDRDHLTLSNIYFQQLRADTQSRTKLGEVQGDPFFAFNNIQVIKETENINGFNS